MQPRQNTIATHPEHQPAQINATRPHLRHANRLDGHNYSFKTAEMRAHKLHFLAALNPPPAALNGQTYPRNSAWSRRNSADVQTFLSPVVAQKPVKNRRFRYHALASLSARAIPLSLCRLNTNPPSTPNSEL